MPPPSSTPPADSASSSGGLRVAGGELGGVQPLVFVLGPVAVAGPDGVERAVRGGRAAALVAALASTGGRAVPVAMLVDELWGADLPADPRAALQNLVSRVRGVGVPGVVVSVPGGGYALGGPSDLDVAASSARTARHALTLGDPAEAVRAAAAALALWRGEPGDGLGHDVAATAATLRSAAAQIRGELEGIRRDAAAAAGDHATVIGLAQDALVADPLDEDAARALMTALAATGHDAEGARVYARLRHALVAELGTDPAPDLVALGERLARSCAAAHEATSVPAVPSADGAPRPTSSATDPSRVREVHVSRGLRVAPNPLLGRDADVAAVMAALDRHRLVTVLGTGGLGKTRLAQEVARRVLDQTPAGEPLLVAVAELAGVRTDADVVLALADGLGLAAAGSTRLGDRILSGDVREQILERLRGTAALLVLDNCEHVATGAARWADDLVTAVPGVRVLATSRAPLQVPAEQVYPLAPLAATTASHDDVGERTGGVVEGRSAGPAVELFRQRARAARPGVRLLDDVVARLCERLDGLPLAIELAAARVRTLSVEEIETLLDQHLSGRFALLRGGTRTAPERHQTLESVIAWSWDLLEPSQQRLWRRVAVLPDGLTAEAATALAASDGPESDGSPVGALRAATLTTTGGLGVLDDIDALVTQSILAVSDEDGTARYRMLETVREFGLLRLAEAGEEDAVRDAMFGWATAVADRCVAALLGPGQVAAAAELRREHENLLFALRAAAQPGPQVSQASSARRPDVVVRTFVALAASWALHGMEDRASGLGPTVLDAVTCWPVPPQDAGATSVALLFAVMAQAFRGPTAMLRPLARLHRLLRDAPPDAIGPRTRGVAEPLLARTSQEMAERIAAMRLHEDPVVAYTAHMAASQAAENDGFLDAAIADAHHAYELAARVGDVACGAAAAMMLAAALSEGGDTERAVEWSRHARPGLEALQAQGGLRQLDWVELAGVLDAQDFDRAEELCARLSDASRSPGDRSVLERTAVADAGRAEIALARGDVRGALAHFEHAVEVLRDEQGPSAPWAVMIGAAATVRLVEAGEDARASRVVADVARRLAEYDRQWTSRRSDHPVLGTACVGAGVLLALGGPTISGLEPEAGLELLLLGDAVGSRQDLRALRREPLLARAQRRYGEAAVATVRERVEMLAHEDLAPRALALLDQVPGLVAGHLVEESQRG